MKFYVYDVHMQNGIDVKYLGHEIKDCLSQLNKVSDRMMNLNKEDSGDFDFISEWSFDSNNILLCSLVRLKKGIVSTISDEDYSKEYIPMEKIMTSSKTANSFKEAIFFAIYKNCIVITSQYSKSVRNHLLWLLEKVNNKYRFEIEVRINQKKTVELGNIKDITIGETYLNERNSTQMRQSTRFIDIKKQVLQTFIDVEDFEEYGDIISASLLLKFNKKKIKSAEAAKFALNLVEDEAVKIRTRDGKTYTGADLREVEEHKVEKTSEGAYNTIDIGTILKDMVMQYGNV